MSLLMRLMIAFAYMTTGMFAYNSRGRDDPSAKEWMETIKGMTETWGAEAKFFENEEGEESSHAFSHAFKLVGCIADLVSGFMSDESSEYVEAIRKLQEEFDSALAAIQTQLDELVRDLQEDFMKIFLAPNAVILDDTVKALTQYSSSNKKSSSVKKVWLAQMEPINDRVDAWNKVALCMMGELTNCPPNMLDIVLADGKSWDRPAVLVQFTAYHYGLLSSSATAICTYEATKKLELGLDLATSSQKCSLIDVTRLQNVAKNLAKGTTSMKSTFWNGMGPNKLTSLMQSAVDANANKQYDGAKTIRDAVGDEMDNFYFKNSLTEFFGIDSWAFAVYGDITGADKHYMWSTGYLYRYKGYNVFYSFSSDTSYSYEDTDCRSGDAHTMADCLHNMHNSACWVLKYNTFWAAHWLNAYSHSFTTSGGDVRIVLDGQQGGALGYSSGRAENPGDMPLVPASDSEGVALPRPAHEGVVLPRYSVQLKDVPSDPQHVLKDISNIFATAGAIADFFGPEGEVVGLVLDFVAAIFGLISTLLGLGKPDPVIEALRTLESDVMGKLSAVQDGVAKAKATARLGSVGNILDNAEVPLMDIVKAWNTFYPQGNTKGKLNQKAANTFKQSIGGNIAKYRDQWNTLVQCLAGTNVDCIFGDRSALQILLMNGQTYMRPYILTEAIQYYYILLQKSSVAICAYAQVFLDDPNCTFLPSLQDGMTSVSNAMKKIVTDMRTEFWDGMGANKLPPVIQYYVDKNANKKYDGAKAARDAIEAEYNNFYFKDGLDKSFGVSAYGVAIYEDITGSDKHYMWATGYLYRYNGFNVMYNFQDGTAYSYEDTDCRSGDAHTMADCLHNMHEDGVWVLKYYAFWATGGYGGYLRSYTTSGGDVRLVDPGTSGSTLGQSSSNCHAESPGNTSEIII